MTFLHSEKKVLEHFLGVAISLGFFQAVPNLKKQIAIVKIKQKLLTFKQKGLLIKSQLIKHRSLKKLKQLLNKPYIQSVRELHPFKKALALQKKRLGKDAITYKPLPNFPQHQKITFSWKMNPFLPLRKNKFSKHQCIATLEKDKNQWKERLFH